VSVNAVPEFHVSLTTEGRPLTAHRYREHAPPRHVVTVTGMLDANHRLWTRSTGHEEWPDRMIPVCITCERRFVNARRKKKT